VALRLGNSATIGVNPLGPVIDPSIYLPETYYALCFKINEKGSNSIRVESGRLRLHDREMNASGPVQCSSDRGMQKAFPVISPLPIDAAKGARRDPHPRAGMGGLRKIALLTFDLTSMPFVAPLRR
jgi:hypothetical protein